MHPLFTSGFGPDTQNQYGVIAGTPEVLDKGKAGESR